MQLHKSKNAGKIPIEKLFLQEVSDNDVSFFNVG